MTKIAVLGYGTVGGGVVELIGRNRDELLGKLGEEISVKYILDVRDFPGDPYEDRVVHDFGLILDDPEVSILCETMGGVGAAYQFTRQALERGKSVCTSNKELVAKHGAELFAIAARNRCSYMYEASVGGGIPIIRSIHSALAADRIESVTGILNGTTNYILTKMEREGADYAQTLAQAQELGYAERNPQADVEGHDTCRKIAILASLVTGRRVDAEKIPTEGIGGITSADFAFAGAAGMTIRLLAACRFAEDSVQAIVAPFMIPKEHPFAIVNDVYNAVLVTGNMLGDCMFYGRGAGKLPTASAVVADVADCVRNAGRPAMGAWTQEESGIDGVADVERRFFVRGAAGARKAIEEVFCGGSNVALPGGASCGGEMGYLTLPMKEKDFNARCAELGGTVLNRIRII